MRRAQEIKEVQVARLEHMLLRPGMHGSGQSLEWTIRSTLQLLAYIDERDDEVSRAFSTIEKNGLWGPLGTAGALASALGGPIDQTDQIAAQFARLASQLGYYRVENRISDAEWTELERLRTWPADWPRTPSAVEARFGVPSFRRNGQWPTVFAYAGPGDEAWLFLVFSASEPQELECIILPRYPLARSVIDLRPRALATTPEEVYRTFFIAMVQGDTATIWTLLVHRVDPMPFFAKPYSADVARSLMEQYRAMDVARVSPSGETVHLVSGACPVPLALVRDGATWRLDAEPLIHFLAGRNPAVV